MLRLLGAILIAGFAVLAAAFGAAWLLDARAIEGGRELALSLVERDEATAARPLVDCQLRPPELGDRRRRLVSVDVNVNGEFAGCPTFELPREIFTPVISHNEALACQFDLEVRDGNASLSAPPDCLNPASFERHALSLISWCVRDFSQATRYVVELHATAPSVQRYQPSADSQLTGCPGS